MTHPRIEAMLSGRLGRFIKFGLVGASGVGVNLLAFHFFYSLVFVLFFDPSMTTTWRMPVSNALGIIVSIFTNFMLNDLWTWGDRQKGAGTKWWYRLFKYYLTCSIAGAVQLGVASLVYKVILGSEPLLLLGYDIGPSVSVLTGIVAGIAINFPVSHVWAFKDDEDDANETV